MENLNEVQLDTELMLVTANVGSLFEDPKKLLSIWVKEFIAKVTEAKPKFLALHLQEVGGKTYENSMDHVQEFIRLLCETMEQADYVYARIYMDEDFKSAEHFTALGNIYFGHKDLCTLRIWNFVNHDWKDKLDDKQIYSGNIEAVSTKEKSKFPQHFFPECKWSRKGFMRTRWEINGTVIELVNIHLFHDASNLAACADFPSVYCKTRRRALIHTIERFHLDDKNGSVPFFLFGDFNFRCDTAGVVKELTESLVAHRVQNVKTENTRIQYRNSAGNNILTVGKKEFTHADHQLKFKEYWLKKFDKELEPLTEVLIEYPITFIPSYPFEEDPEMPADYMSTRCPSWCDRILMTPQVKDIITSNEWKYDIIGESVCMGDHKPTYLTVRLKQNKGTYRSCDCSCIYTQARNNNLTTTVQCKYCPYSNKLFNEIVRRDLNLRREKILQHPSTLLINSDSANILNKTNTSILNTTLDFKEFNDIKHDYPSNYSNISINVVDTDSLPIGEFCNNKYLPKNTQNLFPICHNLKKMSILSTATDQIIVNQNDTLFLNSYFANKNDDPYTPESNESHSPYPELRNTSKSTSSNSCNQFNIELIQRKLCLDSSNCDHNGTIDVDELFCLKSMKALSEKQTTVTPVQLKSRLEDLQRISLPTVGKDDFTNGEDDVDIVKPKCSSKSFSSNQNHNQSIFYMCCSIH